MAYKLQKREIKTQIDLDGEIIDVVINPIKMANQFMDAYTRLCQVQSRMRTLDRLTSKTNPTPEEVTERNAVLTDYGEVIMEVLVIVFGQETTAKIVEFHQNDYTIMLADLLPFIHDEILPAVQDYSNYVKSMSRKAYLQGGGKMGHKGNK